MYDESCTKVLKRKAHLLIKVILGYNHMVYLNLTVYRYTPDFSVIAIFSEDDNFCNFLLASMGDKALSK